MLQERELGLVVGGFLGKEIEQAFHAATGGWRDQPIGCEHHGGSGHRLAHLALRRGRADQQLIGSRTTSGISPGPAAQWLEVQFGEPHQIDRRRVDLLRGIFKYRIWAKSLRD